MKNSSFVTVCLLGENIAYDDIDCIYIYLDRNFEDYEILLIGEQNATKKIIENIPCVRIINYIGNDTINDRRIIALENSIGDYLIFFDPSTDQTSMIGESINKVKSGSEIVLGREKYGNYGLLYTVGRSISKVLVPSIRDIKPGTTNFFCMTRNAINAILKIGSATRQFSVNILSTGLPIDYLDYNLKTRMHKGFLDGIYRTFNIMIFTSKTPLRFISILGFIASFISFIYALYTFVIRFFVANIAPGWTSIILVISSLFMLLFIMLAFLTEYLGRILDAAERRNDCFTVQEITSRVMINRDRLNVLTKSEEEHVE
jgi:hypothetical protein